MGNSRLCVSTGKQYKKKSGQGLQQVSITREITFHGSEKPNISEP